MRDIVDDRTRVPTVGLHDVTLLYVRVRLQASRPWRWRCLVRDAGLQTEWLVGCGELMWWRSGTGRTEVQREVIGFGASLDWANGKCKLDMSKDYSRRQTAHSNPSQPVERAPRPKI
jgi:hypothetical protein